MATTFSPASHIRSICYASNPPKARFSFPGLLETSVFSFLALLGFSYLYKCGVKVEFTADFGNVGSWSASANYVKLQVAARGFSAKPLVVKHTWKKRQVEFLNISL